MADPTVTPLFGVPINAGIQTASRGTGPVDPAAAIAQFMSPAASTGPAPQSHKYVEQSGKHKGVAGVARDILGTLGDFLLTRLHMPAMYGPGQQQRKLEAAWEGHDQDPQAAIDRVTDVDFGAGQKLSNEQTDNARLQAQLDSTKQLREARAADIHDRQVIRSRGNAASYFNALSRVPEKDRPAHYAAIRQKVIATYGKDDPDLADMLPETYDPIASDSFISQNIPAGVQRGQQLTSDRDANNYTLGTERVAQTKVRDANAHEDRQDAEAGRNSRNTTNEAGRNGRNNTNEAGRNGRSATSEAGKTARAGSKAKPSGDDIAYLRAHPELRDRFDGRYGVGTAKQVLGN